MSATVTSLPIQMLPIESLSESPWNPRQVFPEAALNELVESMKSSGFRQWLPLMVRPQGNSYEIGAGHRRRRAAELAGIKEIPCIVREMSDAEFLDVLNFDNSGREDVHPLHEAAGWQQWMEKTGKGVLDIAARIGQSKEYVYQRLKYASLIDAGKAAFLNGEITAGHAVLIARLPQAADQKKALKFCEGANWQGRKKSVRELAQFIQQDVHLELACASFDLTSAELVPSAGSCVACPKRTLNAPDLAVTKEAEPEDAAIDCCTDPACFTAKVDAHLVQIERKLKAAGKDPIYVSDSCKAPKGVLNRSDYQTVKEGTPGARTAIVGQGHEAGKVIHIKVTPKAPSPKGETPEQKKAAEEKQKAATERELSIRREILKAIRPKISGLARPDIEALLMEILHSGREVDELARIHGLKFNPYQGNQAIETTMPKMPEAELFQLAVELPVMEELEGWAITRNEPPARLLALAKRHKVDAAKIRADIEQADAPPADKKPPVVPPAKKKAAKKAVKPASGKRGMIKGKK